MIKSAFMLACSLSFCGLAHAAPAERSAQSPQTYERSILTLASALSEGQTRACVPISLMVTGRSDSGKRFFASANLDEFPQAVRDATRSGAKLNRNQARALEHLTRLAGSASRSGQSLSPAVIENAERDSGFKINARSLCLTEEIVSSRR